MVARYSRGNFWHFEPSDQGTKSPLWAPDVCPKQKEKSTFEKGQGGSLKNSVYRAERVYFSLSLRLKENGSERIEIAPLFTVNVWAFPNVKFQMPPLDPHFDSSRPGHKYFQ